MSLVVDEPFFSVVDEVPPESDCFSTLTPLSELEASEFFLLPQATTLSVSRQASTTAEILVVLIITPSHVDAGRTPP